VGEAGNVENVRPGAGVTEEEAPTMGGKALFSLKEGGATGSTRPGLGPALLHSTLLDSTRSSTRCFTPSLAPKAAKAAGQGRPPMTPLSSARRVLQTSPLQSCSPLDVPAQRGRRAGL
jgi:hypothetical protein